MMAVAVFIIVLLASSLSLGHHTDSSDLDINLSDLDINLSDLDIDFSDLGFDSSEFSNELFSPCTKQQILTLLTGNFSNRCTEIPSVKVIGAPGTKEVYYVQSEGYFNNCARNVLLSYVKCGRVSVNYYGLFRIMNYTRERLDPNTGLKTVVSTRDIHFTPNRYPNHTVVINVSLGTCDGEVRAIVMANHGVLAEIACNLFVDPIPNDYTYVATLDPHPTDVTVAGYKNQIDQAFGQVTTQVRISQDNCTQML